MELLWSTYVWGVRRGKGETTMVYLCVGSEKGQRWDYCGLPCVVSEKGQRWDYCGLSMCGERRGAEVVLLWSTHVWGVKRSIGATAVVCPCVVSEKRQRGDYCGLPMCGE